MLTIQEKSNIKLDIYDNFNSLESIQEQWDQFVQSVDGDVFMTYDWLRIWWKYYGTGRVLKIFIFRENDNLIGIFPLFFEKINIGPFSLGCGKIVGTDFTISSVMLPIAKEHLIDVMQMLFKEVRNSWPWDVLHLGPISGIYSEFENILTLCNQYLKPKCRIKTCNNNVQTFFVLTDNQGAPTKIISKKCESSLKQKYRILHDSLGDKTATLNSRYITDIEFEEAFSNFIEMHQQHWLKQNRAGHFGDWPTSRDFHYEMAKAQLKRDRLRLLEVKADGPPLGYKYSYIFGNKLVEFLDARMDGEVFSRAGLGNIIFYELLKKANVEKVRYIDSLRGKYEHKLRMGGKLFGIKNIYIIREGLIPNMRVNVFQFLAKLLDIFYYKIWFSRISIKLPLKPRPLWKTWIRSSVFAH